jgi:regulator of sirC expression with transglutaminase-like and TPR domain
MVEDIRRDLEAEASPTAILHQLSDYLFQQLGFHGSRLDYYSRENSYLSTVLEDREGIPITLSVLFMELSRRLGVEDVVGIPLPGHFVVQYRPDADDPASHPMIDVYEGGSTLTRIDAEKLVRETTGLALDESDLVPASKPAILVRMLRNLINIDLNSEDPTQALPELDLLLSISSGEASERLSRALLLYQSRQWDRAREDIEWILEHAPPGIHLDRVRELRRRIDSGFPR